ncbi:MAG TPA: SCO family protein [Candidatus Sulfotelmatobacter sp.]|nr:SCO family protein [Candidatus Sulfotelmatobacter sp.]
MKTGDIVLWNRGADLARRLLAFIAVASTALLAAPFTCRAQLQAPIQNIGVRPELLKDVGIDQNLNSQVPLELEFRDEKGRSVRLSEFFSKGRPVILSLVYYNCPMLCTQVLNGLLRSLKEQSLNPGKDFEVLTVSIDPTERPVLASAKHDLYTGIYARPGAAEGWHFLTGEEAQVKQLAHALGFRYAYDPGSKQFAHASAIFILTPDGKISRYFYGIQYPERDLRLGLVEASHGKIGTPVDQILLFCYHYDPVTGKYGLLISRVIKAAGLATVLAIGALVFILGRREHYSLPARKA